MKKIAIIGSGSWGVALGMYLAGRGNNIVMWSFDENEKNQINNEKKSMYLPKVTIPDNIFCTTSFEETLKDAEIILHVTPSKFVRDTVKKYKEYVKDNQMLIMCSKGFEADTQLTLDEIIKEELPNVKFGILSRTKSCRRSKCKYSNCFSNCI